MERDPNVHVLIVDDEPAITRVVCSMLQEDYQCLTAGSAEEALSLLEMEDIGLLISDIHMRGMNGLELIPPVLKTSPDTVVVLMSGAETIDSAIEAMRVGAFDYIRKPLDFEHVRVAVRRALDHRSLLLAKCRYENHLEELVKQRTAELEHLTCYDAVTDLPNRVLCEDRLALALSLAQRSKRMVGVLAISIDQLDAVKDAFGHALADEIFREVARRLSSRLREGDSAGRFEGNEFVVVLSQIEQADEVAIAVNYVRDALATPVTLNRNDISLTASIGVSLYPSDGQSPDILFRNAHSARCRATKLSEVSCQFYSPDMHVAMLRHLSLENRRRRSIERGDFELYYQPQVDINTGDIVGAEALVRWRDPEGECIPQADFIKVAEDSGLIVPIGEWVLRTACNQMSLWRQRGLDRLRVAVNLSARQFQQKDLTGMLSRILCEMGTQANTLELELTESFVMQDLQSSAGVLRELKSMGIQIAVDDFGTGYSSLSCLKKLPVDRLKIDQSFIRDLTTDTDSSALVLTIITLAHNLRLGVIAEGVETADQLRLLHLLSCDQWQGFLCSKPVPVDEFERLLTRSANLIKDPKTIPDGRGAIVAS